MHDKSGGSSAEAKNHGFSRALVLSGGGVAGIAWEIGLIVGLSELGTDVRVADLFVGTSAGATVAAQLLSGLTMDELFNRQVDPTLQAKELPVQADFPKLIADFKECHRLGGSSSEILRRIGALALSAPTVPAETRRKVIVSRLPVQSWPQKQLKIAAVDAASGERIVFGPASGVSLVDAVMASSAVPCVWPTAAINRRQYIDGGCYSMSNADLSDGFDRILVLEPDVPPLPVIEGLAEQLERLRRNGAQVEVVRPDEAMKSALAAAGGNALDPSLRGVAATLGRGQSRREAGRITRLWE